MLFVRTYFNTYSFIKCEASFSRTKYFYFYILYMYAILNYFELVTN